MLGSQKQFSFDDADSPNELRRQPNRIEIGCCGWSYADWVGPFYRAGTKPADFLEQYAERFDIVEVDSTFYRTPSRRMVDGWNQRTPDHFRFSLKVPQIVTHDKLLQDCQEELDGFLAVARLLGHKLHSVCLQFGYFNRKAFADLQQFLGRLAPFLANWPSDIPVAVEIRNRNWMTGEYAQCLKSHRASMVLALQSWMPTPAVIMKEIDVLTGSFAYVRLLGDRKGIEQITTTWDKVVIDKNPEVDKIAESIRDLAKSVPVVTFVNNHFAGFAPETAEVLRRLVATSPEVPSS